MPCLCDDCQDSFPFEKVCRTCLTVLNPVNDIFETTLGSGDPVYLVLNYVCGLKISAEDRIPPNICISCLWKIKDFFAFKKNALFADSLLQEIVDDVGCKRTKSSSVVEEGIERQLQTEYLFEAPIIKEEQSLAIPYNDLSEASNAECAVDDESIAPQPREIEDYISNSSVGDLPEQGRRYSAGDNEGIPVTRIRDVELGYSPAEKECGPKSKDLKSYLPTHTGEKPFKCPNCDFRCSRKHDLKKHIRIHTGEKPYKCPHCDYRCSQKCNLKKHIRIHTGEKPYKCPHCDFRCSQKHHLKEHILSHTGEKPFKCPHCDFRCSRKHHLKEHILVHNGERPFECPHCEYRCSKKFNLKAHLLTHTGEKPFECPLCEYRCSKKFNLKSHLLTHTGEKPFKCPHCDFRCSWKSILKNHILKHNGL